MLSRPGSGSACSYQRFSYSQHSQPSQPWRRQDLHALAERQHSGAERQRGAVLGRGDVLDLHVSEIRRERQVGLPGLLAAQPGVHDVPQGADLPMPHEAEHAEGVRAGPVRVVGLQQNAYAEVGGVLRGGAEPPGGDGVGVFVLAAGEDPDEGRPEVTGEVDEFPDLLDHGLVVARRGDPRVAREPQDLDARRLEPGRGVGPFVRTQPRMDRLLRMGAQLHAVIAVRDREPQHLGQGDTGNTEGGEG
ncbi:hypothetical protein QF030_003333 [Streptomyces rishiriensis]|uniref:Uncharacterized protein n=1 Tax=Streptomyces rishiriensis TaxID=68264 RepID=A0ABU0NRM4_STRRH|nr:hypothetical protein [Streptomyces rishiriensis]